MVEEALKIYLVKRKIMGKSLFDTTFSYHSFQYLESMFNEIKGFLPNIDVYVFIKEFAEPVGESSRYERPIFKVKKHYRDYIRQLQE